MMDRYRSWNPGTPDFVTIETEKESRVISGQANPAVGGGTTVSFSEIKETLQIQVTSQDALLGVKLRWQYRLAKDARFLGDAWERGYGDLRWQGMSGSRFMPWYFLAAGAENTQCFGVMVRPAAMCFWQADTKGVTLYLDLRSGGRGVELKGQTLEAAKVVCMEGPSEDTFGTAREFCRRMCVDPLLPAFPVYGSNNWYYAYGDSSDVQIQKDADYLLALTQGVSNPPFMVVDDGWQVNHRLEEYNGGPWRKGNDKFPDLGALARELKEKKVRPGIWVRLLLNEDPAIPWEWRISHNGCLDPSHPEALDYIRQDIRQICDWGYQLIKHDFSTYDLFGMWGFEANLLNVRDDWHFYDRGKTSAQIVTLLYEAICQEAAPKDVLILGCNTIGHLGAGLMHLNRTGDDTSGRIWERSRKMGVNTLAFRLPQHGAFYDVDADCVGINGSIPWEKNRQWAEVIARSGTPLFLSVKPGILKKEEEEELRSIMKIASEQKQHMIPMDWEDTDCPEIWSDGKQTVTYDWYEEAGPVLSAATERFNAPLAVP